MLIMTSDVTITASSSFVNIATRQPTLDYLPTFSPPSFHSLRLCPSLSIQSYVGPCRLWVITHTERLCSLYTLFTPTYTLCCRRVAQKWGCVVECGRDSPTLRHPQFTPHFATKRGVSCSSPYYYQISN